MAKGVEIKGDKGLMRMLKELPKSVESKINRRAVNLATTPILQEAKAECPVDEGDLRKSIIKKVTSKKGVADGIVGSDAAYVGENGKLAYKYDHLVHDGHATEDGGSVPANPYLQRAWDNSIGTARTKHEQELASGIESEAAKLAASK